LPLSRYRTVKVLDGLSRMGWLIGKGHHQAGGMKGDDQARRAERFDPLLGARALEMLAGFALLCRDPSQLIDLESPMMVAASDVLRTAKGWLALQHAGAVFSGDVVLGARYKRASLSLGGFAAALKQSATELQQLAPPPSS
jgi:hypothetical protein